GLYVLRLDGTVREELVRALSAGDVGKAVTRQCRVHDGELVIERETMEKSEEDIAVGKSGVAAPLKPDPLRLKPPPSKNLYSSAEVLLHPKSFWSQRARSSRKADGRSKS